MKQVLILAALILSACHSRKERLTTDPKIALQNLDGQIEELEKAHARSPEALQFTGTLVGLLATRAQYLGRLSDYDRALALAEEALHRAPDNESALLMRAGARSSLHRFSIRRSCATSNVRRRERSTSLTNTALTPKRKRESSRPRTSASANAANRLRRRSTCRAM